MRYLYLLFLSVWLCGPAQANSFSCFDDPPAAATTDPAQYIIESVGSGFDGPVHALVMDQDGYHVVGAKRGSRKMKEIKIPKAKQSTWRVEEEFINAIRGRESIKFTDFETGVQYMEWTDAVADQTGLEVDLDNVGEFLEWIETKEQQPGPQAIADQVRKRCRSFFKSKGAQA